MKLEIARGMFLVGALGIASIAMAAWETPKPKILSAVHGEGQCALPRVAKAESPVRPDHDLLLLMFGLAQGTRGQN
ncbi:hypothetical protein N5D61_08480 [Pseudomonas sp. GD03842]|uniref:hypothetical protein n=1 Tax=unclassified Pseudomonas TaxID=196821 RepID=UPI000D34550A|nr:MULTISPECIES: hypothetical protein [unclassified Pseudomonas]MDH0746376.1 hypothetical protein [Pseudomonas sp. GD03842]RAU47025.1 hypothetical protein DBP26_009020 [Pseudomonas sp. RIT 409]RAU54642.1 hypothetical protein DBY65_010030 [Pseudomonas sp. RIT 412]